MTSYGGIFLRSLRDLVRGPILGQVLATGIPMILIWIGIGWVVWDELLVWTTKLISWVPFSIVKADGAMLVLFLLWGVAVLATFAFVTAIFAPLIFRKMRRGYYYYSFSALLLLAAGWAWYFMANWHTLKVAIADKLLVWLPFQTVAEGSAWLLNFYILYSFYILSIYLLLSFYRKDFLETVREIEYPDSSLNEKRLKTLHSFIALRDGLMFLVMTVVLFPLLLIPIVNVLIQLFLWAWLYRDSNFRGTCKLYCDQATYERLRHHSFIIWSIAFFASLLNFIPIINLFTPFFAQLVAFHWIMQEQGAVPTPVSEKREGDDDGE
jgi:hypothetical protein